MVKKLDLALFRKQSQIDTPISNLVASDFVDTIETPSLDITPDAEQDNRGGGGFDNYPATIGKYEPGISLVFAIYSLGSGLTPDLVRCMECSGFEAVNHDDYIRMRGISEIVNAGTLWGYYGGPGTDKSLLEKFGNVIFDPTIEFESGKRATLTLAGKGQYIATPIVATQPDISPHRERVTSPPLMGGNITIMGQAYGLIRGSFVGGQGVENRVDPTNEFGGGGTEITERNQTWTAVVYQKPQNVIVPHNALKLGSTGLIEIKWGNKFGNKDCILRATQAQITDIKPGDNNGISTWELSGITQRNDLELRIYNNAASSSSLSSQSSSSISGSVSSSSNSSNSSSSSLSP